MESRDKHYIELPDEESDVPVVEVEAKTPFAGDVENQNRKNDDSANLAVNSTMVNSDSDLSTSTPVAERRQSSSSESSSETEGCSEGRMMTENEAMEIFARPSCPANMGHFLAAFGYMKNQKSSTDSDCMYGEEYEVASESDEDNPIEDANSSSGVDEPFNMPRYEVDYVDGDRDSDNFADDEMQVGDTESDPNRETTRIKKSESEISEKVKWCCNRCGARSPRYIRFCLPCFRLRRNWLPKRTKPRLVKRKKLAKGSNRGNEAKSGPLPSTSRDSSANTGKMDCRSDRPTPPESDDSSSERMMESFSKNVSIPAEDNDADTVNGPINNTGIVSPPLSNPQSHQEIDSQCSSSNKPSPKAMVPPESPMSSPTSQPSLLPRNSQYPSTSKFFQSPAIENKVKIEMPIPVSNHDESRSNVPMCNICYIREKDSAFVHNKIAHQFCCFVCANKILKNNGRCPVCRDRVFKVVKIISV